MTQTSKSRMVGIKKEAEDLIIKADGLITESLEALTHVSANKLMKELIEDQRLVVTHFTNILRGEREFKDSILPVYKKKVLDEAHLDKFRLWTIVNSLEAIKEKLLDTVQRNQ